MMLMLRVGTAASWDLPRAVTLIKIFHLIFTIPLRKMISSSRFDPQFILLRVEKTKVEAGNW